MCLDAPSTYNALPPQLVHASQAHIKDPSGKPAQTGNPVMDCPVFMIALPCSIQSISTLGPGHSPMSPGDLTEVDTW